MYLAKNSETIDVDWGLSKKYVQLINWRYFQIEVKTKQYIYCCIITEVFCQRNVWKLNNPRCNQTTILTERKSLQIWFLLSTGCSIGLLCTRSCNILCRHKHKYPYVCNPNVKQNWNKPLTNIFSVELVVNVIL